MSGCGPGAFASRNYPAPHPLVQEARVGTHQTEAEIAAYLLRRYGPRLDRKQVAEALGFQPETLRVDLYTRKRQNKRHIQSLLAKKRKLGRRTYWLPADIAALLSRSDS